MEKGQVICPGLHSKGQGLNPSNPVAKTICLASPLHCLAQAPGCASVHPTLSWDSRLSPAFRPQRHHGLLAPSCRRKFNYTVFVIYVLRWEPEPHQQEARSAS